MDNYMNFFLYVASAKLTSNFAVYNLQNKLLFFSGL